MLKKYDLLVHAANQNLLRRSWAEHFRLLSNYSPLDFARNITTEVFDTLILDDFYKRKDPETKERALDNIVTVLGGAFRIDHRSFDSLYGFLSWDLENFRGKRRDVSNEASYVHQLQVSSIVAVYISQLSKTALNNEERQILLFSSLGHDTIEDGMLGGRGVYRYDLEEVLVENSLSSAVIGRTSNIISHLTREKGDAGLYRPAIANISSIGYTRDRTFAYIVKMADRINNLLTLKNLTSNDNVSWNRKNVFKAYALLESLEKDLVNDRIDKQFKDVVVRMYRDITRLCEDELGREMEYHKRSAQKRAFNFFEQKKGDGQREAKIPVHIEERDAKYFKEPQEKLTMVMVRDLFNLGYPIRYSVSEEPRSRSVDGYFNKLRDVINGWFLYNEFLKKEFASDEYASEKYEEARLLQETYIQMGQPPYEDIFDKFTMHFETMINPHYNKRLSPEAFFSGLLQGFGEIYKLKALFKYEVHRDREGVMPAVLFEELSRKREESSIYAQPVNSVIENLFGHAQSHILSKMIEAIGTNLDTYLS